MNTVKVKAKVIEDDSGIFSEIVILLDQNQEIIQPLMEYVLKLKRDGRSPSTINVCVKAVQLLLEYMVANQSGFVSLQAMFENFTSRLYTGTISDTGLDSSGLYWLPCSKPLMKSYINALSGFTDWLVEKHDAKSLNPIIEADNYTQRLNYAAWFRKNQNDFLGHIKDRHISSTVYYARSIQGKRPLGKQKTDAIEFPELHFPEFYFSGLGGAQTRHMVLRDQLVVLLMHGGGLRESEALHLWIDDVFEDFLNQNSVKVYIYHPEDGKAPNGWKSASGKTTRAAYLKEKYALSPRNQLTGKQRVGWKGTVLDSRDNYIEVHWFPTIFGEIFAKIWKDYIRILAGIKRNHPYAFVSFHPNHLGNAYTLNAFHDNYRKSLKRIGLEPNKSEGLSPHSHRHSYGRRLRRAGVDPVVIKKCLHHASIESQTVYTTPTAKEITLSLNNATERLLSPIKEIEQIGIPSWEGLTINGFEDVDPNGLFTGQYAKLRNEYER